jgi:hypothetical protein
VPGHSITLWKLRSTSTPSGQLAQEAVDFNYSAQAESVKIFLRPRLVSFSEQRCDSLTYYVISGIILRLKYGEENVKSIYYRNTATFGTLSTALLCLHVKSNLGSTVSMRNELLVTRDTLGELFLLT